MRSIAAPIYSDERMSGLCPICRTAFEDVELQQAYNSTIGPRSHPVGPSTIGGTPTSIQSRRQDPFGPPLPTLPLTCPNGHTLPAVYIVGDNRPTYFVALCGGRGTGKTFLLYSLAKTALEKGRQLAGFSIEIADSLSTEYFYRLDNEFRETGKLQRTLGTKFIGLGFSRPEQDRSDGFNLLFIDPPGDFFDPRNFATKPEASRELGHLPLADVAVFTAAGSLLDEVASNPSDSHNTGLSARITDHATTINLISHSFEQAKPLRQGKTNREARIPGIVAITMADKLETSAGIAMKTIFGDTGQIPIVPGPNETAFTYDFQTSFTENEMRAMLWRTSYARVLLNKLTPNFLAATDSVLDVSIATAFSSTGREPTGETGTEIAPWGVLGLLSWLLAIVGRLDTDTDTMLEFLKNDLALMRQALVDGQGLR